MISDISTANHYNGSAAVIMSLAGDHVIEKSNSVGIACAAFPDVYTVFMVIWSTKFVQANFPSWLQLYCCRLGHHRNQHQHHHHPRTCWRQRAQPYWLGPLNELRAVLQWETWNAFESNWEICCGCLRNRELNADLGWSARTVRVLLMSACINAPEKRKKTKWKRTEMSVIRY